MWKWLCNKVETRKDFTFYYLRLYFVNQQFRNGYSLISVLSILFEVICGKWIIFSYFLYLGLLYNSLLIWSLGFLIFFLIVSLVLFSKYLSMKPILSISFYIYGLMWCEIVNGYIHFPNEVWRCPIDALINIIVWKTYFFSGFSQASVVKFLREDNLIFLCAHLLF